MNNFRNFAVWVIIALLLFALFNLFQGPTQRAVSSEISYSQFLEKVETGEVRSVTIAGDSVTGHFSDGRAFQTYTPQDPNLVSRLRDKAIEIKARPATEDNFLPGVLLS